MNPNKFQQKNVVKGLREAHPALIDKDMILAEVLAAINAETENECVIIFEEWNYPIWELTEDSRERLDYIGFLRMMF